MPEKWRYISHKDVSSAYGLAADEMLAHSVAYNNSVPILHLYNFLPSVIVGRYQDIEAAIEKDKDDIARLLIKKLKPQDYHRNELGRHIQTLGKEISQISESVEEQRLQYQQLQIRAKEYFHRVEREKWEKTTATKIPSTATVEPSEEDVELELLKRKETAEGGVKQ